jgi:DNA anti-recombination protein RmuC
VWAREQVVSNSKGNSTKKSINMQYGEATNRLNEIHEHNTLVAQEFDKLINAMASWNNCFTVKQSIELAGDLIKLKNKWENKFKNECNDN